MSTIDISVYLKYYCIVLSGRGLFHSQKTRYKSCHWGDTSLQKAHIFSQNVHIRPLKVHIST